MENAITFLSNQKQPLSLRERKKRLTQKTIEETAFRLFRQKGYEQTSIQDIVDEVMMSSRTFFRYFSSKEEVLLAPTLVVMRRGIRYLQEVEVEVIETPFSALRAVLMHMAEQYEEQREIFLVCFQLVRKSPQLSYPFVNSQFTTESPLCDILCERLPGVNDRRAMHLLVAIMMTVLRETLIVWLEQEARGELKDLLNDNLEKLDSFFKN